MGWEWVITNAQLNKLVFKLCLRNKLRRRNNSGACELTTQAFDRCIGHRDGCFAHRKDVGLGVDGGWVEVFFERVCWIAGVKNGLDEIGRQSLGSMIERGFEGDGVHLVRG